MNNSIVIQVSTIDGVKNIILAQYGSVKSFCDVHSLNYPIITNVLNQQNFRHSHIKKICQILGLDIEKIERWKDV